MAKKKQQRRRAKERRHEYEEVFVDAEGNEISAEEYEELTGETVEGKAKAAGDGKADAPIQGRRGRTINPPSWSRVLKRGAIFAPIMFIVVMFVAPKGTAIAEVAVQTALLMLIFLPFSYIMDTLTYRLSRRRAAQSGSANRT